MAQLVCPGRHTITSLLTTNGKANQDWTSEYNLYAQQRVKPEALFNQVRHEVDALRDTTQPLVVALDDTILRKTGRHIPGAAYRKDPLGPPFNLNLVWAQRVIQFAAAVPGAEGQVRMVPIAFKDASTPRKPRVTEPEANWERYREVLKQTNLNKRAMNMCHQLQEDRRIGEQAPPPLHLVVDGSYTNRKVLRNLPANTTLIGRIRKDAKLNWLPTEQAEKGRRRIYGDDAPTPEALRQDSSVPWQTVEVFAAGKKREIRIKTMGPLRWRSAGKQDLRVVVIAPLGYRRKKGSPILYRRPAYLICTDPDLSLEQLVQEYIWRWDIEVNHRDEKTLLGVGQAQVRNPHSAESVPACAVASYSMLHVAAMHAYGWDGKPNVIPPPKWQSAEKRKRASTLDLINELRRELWSRAIRPSHLTDFMRAAPRDTKSVKWGPTLCDAVFRATA